MDPPRHKRPLGWSALASHALSPDLHCKLLLSATLTNSPPRCLEHHFASLSETPTLSPTDSTMNFSLAIVLLAIAATVAFSQNVTNSTGPCCFDTAFAVAPNMMKVNASTTAPLASSDFHSLVLNGTDNGVHLGNIQDALSSGMNVSDAVARLLMAQNATTAVPN